MLLTLYYMYATFLQWWRINSMRKKISKALTSQTALVLYEKEKQPISKHYANIKDLLFFTESKIGCTMVPRRRILLNNWMPFCSSTLFPILSNNLKLNAPSFPILIRTDINSFQTGNYYDRLQITNLGIPIAWTADNEFSLVLKTDLDNFAKLVTCFLSNSITINDGMEVLQIETIDLDGEPKLVENESAFKRIQWPFPVSNHRQWNKFVDDLKNICKKTTNFNCTKNENGCVDRISDNKNTIPIIVSEVKSNAKNHVEQKPEKRHHKRQTDRTNAVEKQTRVKDKDKLKPSSSKTKEHHHHHNKVKEREKKVTKKRLEDRGEVKKEEVVMEVKKKELEIEMNKKGSKKVFQKSKPPNVLVYADNLETKANVQTVLNEVLNRNRYTIYELPSSGLLHFADNSLLVVVCGNVNPNLSSHLLSYFLNGGNLLCLCSDFLNSVLPTFTTAEVREHELVRFSYREWKQVKMMHHIFCYQASPAKRLFSQDSDQSSNNHSPLAPRTPSTVDLRHNNKIYTVQVRVLGQEETWQTPSILLATVKGGLGKAVFSQVHLEIDPTQYQSDENKYSTLKDSNSARLDILRDILSSHLDMDCTQAQRESDDYVPAYFLGVHELKLQMLKELSGLSDNILKLRKLTLQFCGKGVEPPAPSSSLLPVLIHSCPEHFSTVEYFETLQTTELGRLVIYSDVMTSSMDVLDNVKYKHGLVVLPARQTAGQGRGGNAWLSPLGCAMFSMQVHIPMQSVLGSGLSLLQHLVSVAIVSGIRSQPGYEDIDLGLKWPNDVYADSSIKIGGIILNSSVELTTAVCNIGSGTNLDNALPTTCINSLIRKYNETNGTALKTISYERYLALVFNEMERIYNIIQNGDLQYFYDLYYKYWLHSGAEITIQTSDGSTREVKITGIDQFGYLAVTSKDGVTSSVEPDGNTFDMMEGLIAPKIR